MSISNKEIVRTVIEASIAGDDNTVRRFLDPEIQVFEAESLPFGGVTKGIEEWFGLVKRVFTSWKQTNMTVDRYIADGDDVVVFADLSGYGKTTGKAFSVPIAESWRVINGKVVEIRPYYFDTKLLHDVYFGDGHPERVSTPPPGQED